MNACHDIALATADPTSNVQHRTSNVEDASLCFFIGLTKSQELTAKSQPLIIDQNSSSVYSHRFLLFQVDIQEKQMPGHSYAGDGA